MKRLTVCNIFIIYLQIFVDEILLMHMHTCIVMSGAIHWKGLLNFPCTCTHFGNPEKDNVW